MAIIQYLKETRGELNHVAWPTQLQTVVYTILVALVSIGVALYLGFFDFLFTTGLARYLGASAPQGTNPAIEVSTSSGATTTPINLELPTE